VDESTHSRHGRLLSTRRHATTDPTGSTQPSPAAACVDGPITPTLILDGLTRIHDESLGGLTVGLTFRPGQQDHPSSGCVFYEFLTTTDWVAPQGSRPPLTDHQFRFPAVDPRPW
jgi:hypothetical protein